LDDEHQEVRSLLPISGRMDYGEFTWDEKDVPPGKLLIRVDVARQTMSVFKGPHEIGAAVILYGADHKPTPEGRFRIIEKKAQHRSNIYDAEMPFMLRLTMDGIAIHGSDVRASSATNGCIGVPTEFARALFQVATPGDEVVILS
jgi:lipoprotein-anchoring transpeptidase ErfK/SrfK